MKQILHAAAFLTCIALAGCAPTSPSATNISTAGSSAPSADSLTGEYEFAGGNTNDVYLAISIQSEGDSVALKFQGAQPDGHGAAPEGDGVGRVDADGVFRFRYEDSFSNRGTGTFRKSQDGARLSIRIHQVAEPRCMMFYGDHTLRRVISKSTSSTE